MAYERRNEGAVPRAPGGFFNALTGRYAAPQASFYERPENAHLREVRGENRALVKDLRGILESFESNPHLRELLSPVAESQAVAAASRSVDVGTATAKREAGERASALGLGRGFVARQGFEADLAGAGAKAGIRGEQAVRRREVGTAVAGQVAQTKSDIETLERNLNVELSGMSAAADAQREAERRAKRSARRGLVLSLAGAAVGGAAGFALAGAPGGMSAGMGGLIGAQTGAQVGGAVGGAPGTGAVIGGGFGGIAAMNQGQQMLAAMQGVVPGGGQPTNAVGFNPLLAFALGQLSFGGISGGGAAPAPAPAAPTSYYSAATERAASGKSGSYF